MLCVLEPAIKWNVVEDNIYRTVQQIALGDYFSTFIVVRWEYHQTDLEFQHARWTKPWE